MYYIFILISNGTCTGSGLKEIKSDLSLHAYPFISDEEWKAIFLIPTLSPVENKIKDLQYKIIMRFVPTNYLLYKMKKVSSQTCRFCNLEPETIEHLYFQCIHVKDIWWYVFEELCKIDR